MSNQRKSTPQIVMAGDSARARRRDPLTSHRAADLANLPDSQRDVLKKLRVYKMLAAIDRLESMREEAPPGPWEHWPSQSSGRLYSGLDLDHPISAEEVLNAHSKHSTQLVEVLHRTIDAQLAILHLAVEYGDLPNGQGSRFSASAGALADAILGGDS